MFTYTAYGLSIHSELALPALLPADGLPDVTIRIADLDHVTTELSAAPREHRLTPDEGHLLWEGIATYVVRGGREILVDPVPGVDARSVRLGITGPSLAMLLQQRGYLLLHASGVVMGEGAVVFLGNPGRGKSTTAAALHARGYPLLVDDIVAVPFHSSESTVAPGFPQFKLWPDAVRALGEDPESLSEIEPNYVKRARPISRGFWTCGALPLRCVYVLGWNDLLRIDRLSVREAFLEIAYHSYAIRWMHEISGPAYLRARAELAQRVPVRRLLRPHGFARLPEVLESIAKDVAELPEVNMGRGA